jgi:Asp-tRNA(Asn)/Glu-tRNA(Gln) amidotransferase A subunit family amidase
MRRLGLPEVLTFEVATLSSKLRAREISSVEATEAYLDWISERDCRLGSYITVTPERARADAARADREIGAGNWRGPFHGVPLGLKDNLYTKGVLPPLVRRSLRIFDLISTPPPGRSLLHKGRFCSAS